MDLELQLVDLDLTWTWLLLDLIQVCKKNFTRHRWGAYRPTLLLQFP